MTSTLRVLGVSASAIMSGAERVLFDYALSGTERGEQWTLAVPPGRFRDQLTEAGLACIDLPILHVGEGGQLGRVLRSITATIRASWLLRRVSRDADVVVVNSMRALPAVWLARTSTPVAWLIHDVIEREGIRRLVRSTKSAVDLAIGVSHEAARFANSIGIPSKVVSNGTRWPVAPRHDQDPDELPIIGINAALTPWKGHRVFLEAADLVTKPARFEVMGSAPFEGDRQYEVDLLTQATKLECGERVAFLGHCDDPQAVMRRWSASVSASIEPEAGPLAVLESMALGVPVIVTNHGGGPELVADTGLIVPPGDAAALAKAIDGILEDPDLAADVGRRALARVRDHFTQARANERFGAIMRQLAGDRRS